MTAKQRLMSALFEDKERRHVNLKFLRGTASNVSEEMLCEQSLSAITQVESGKAERRSTFGDSAAPQRSISQILKT